MSRHRLAQALAQSATPPLEGGPWPGPGDPPAPLPPAPLVAALLRRWWRRNPWHRVGTLAWQAGNELAHPAAQAHPVALMAGAAAAGAALVWMRPWRLHRGPWLPWLVSRWLRSASS